MCLVQRPFRNAGGNTLYPINTAPDAGVGSLDGQSFDLVVVGAGIAGLKTLNSAAEYLPKGAPVLLIDPKPAPAYIVGGCKTGMNTAIEPRRQNPGRTVGMLVRQGTNFSSRNKNLPRGVRHWTSGVPTSRVFHVMAMRFDGDNEAETIARSDRTDATEPSANNKYFLYGLLSDEELQRIKDGVAGRKCDYLEDAIDTADGTEMRLRSGETLAIPTGSIIVACTGSQFRDRGLNSAKPRLWS